MESRSSASIGENDISVREWTVHDRLESILVREIGSENEDGLLRYRAELIGPDRKVVAVIDGFSADDLAELLPRAISCFAAARRLRRRV